MAECVVDLFEVIEVEIQHGDQFAVGPIPESCAKAVVEQGAVWKFSERVMEGQMLHLGVAFSQSVRTPIQKEEETPNETEHHCQRGGGYRRNSADHSSSWSVGLPYEVSDRATGGRG